MIRAEEKWNWRSRNALVWEDIPTSVNVKTILNVPVAGGASR
jgi:hypothetical protein